MGMRLALCVGINDYPGTGLDLGGCVNDAQDWSQLLRGQGYEVVTLLDRFATRTEIMTQLDSMVARAVKSGDRIVFTYSGHGSWVTDVSGDEPDHRDEVMCTYDFQSQGYLTDDDLALVFDRVAGGVGALVLSDSCHSGTITRMASLTGVVQPTATPKFIPPHLFIDIDQDEAAELERAVSPAPRKFASLVAGCGDYEFSYDAFFTKPNGAFTYYATQTWAPGISLNDWFKKIREKLPEVPNYPQTPQLYASSSYRKYARAI